MVVTEPCRGCKHGDCITVCPADCFHEGEHMLFINPDRCIDCGLCAAECPVQAIFFEDFVPEPWRSYIELNRVMSESRPRMLAKKFA